MKKKIVLLLAILVLLSGCGKVPKLENGQEAVVTFKDGSMISVDDLYKELKETYGTDQVIEMIDRKIFEDKYKDEIKDAEENAANTLESLKTYYKDEDGNYDEYTLLSELNRYYGFTSISDYEEYIKMNYLRNLAIEDYVESTISDKEIEKYYNNEVYAKREILHILITPETTSSMTDDEKSEAEKEALNEAKALIARLKKGENFEDLAKEASDDELTKEDGGSLGEINKGYYGSDEFDNEAFSLKVGSYSKTPVKTNRGYEIIYVKSELEKDPLEDMKEEIIETLRDEALEKDATLQVTAIIELRKEYGIEIQDDKIKTMYNDYMDRLMLNAENSNKEN